MELTESYPACCNSRFSLAVNTFLLQSSPLITSVTSKVCTGGKTLPGTWGRSNAAECWRERVPRAGRECMARVYWRFKIPRLLLLQHSAIAAAWYPCTWPLLLQQQGKAAVKIAQTPYGAAVVVSCLSQHPELVLCSPSQPLCYTATSDLPDSAHSLGRSPLLEC